MTIIPRACLIQLSFTLAFILLLEVEKSTGSLDAIHTKYIEVVEHPGERPFLCYTEDFSKIDQED